MLYFLWKKPFSISTVLSEKLVNDLLSNLPKLDSNNNSSLVEKKEKITLTV